MISPSNLMKSKSRIRWEMKKKWELLADTNVSLFYRERLEENLKMVLSKFPGVWASYRPLKHEANPLVGGVSGIQWVYPRIDGSTLVFSSCENQEWVKHPYGMEEPSDKTPIVELKDIKGVLVPGVAFDDFGGRLGRGAGFYDRTLAGTDAALLKVGVGYGFQMRRQLPMDIHDIPMDLIVTDETVLNCGGY